MPKQPIGFDYSTISHEHQAVVADHAKAITTHLRSSGAAMIDIGRRLIQVRAMLLTVFQPWLFAEFKWSKSTAQCYMQAADRFGDLDCLDYFQPSALVLLSRNAVPKAAIGQAIAHARAGNIISKTSAKELIARFKVASVAGPEETLKVYGTAAVTGSDKARAGRNVTSLFGSLKTLRKNLKQYTSHMSDSQRESLVSELMAVANEIRCTRSEAGVPSSVPMDSRNGQSKPARSLEPAMV